MYFIHVFRERKCFHFNYFPTRQLHKKTIESHVRDVHVRTQRLVYLCFSVVLFGKNKTLKHHYTVENWKRKNHVVIVHTNGISTDRLKALKNRSVTMFANQMKRRRYVNTLNCVLRTETLLPFFNVFFFWIILDIGILPPKLPQIIKVLIRNRNWKLW